MLLKKKKKNGVKPELYSINDDGSYSLLMTYNMRASASSQSWKENLKETPKPRNGKKHGQNLYTRCNKWSSKQMRSKDAWYIQGMRLKEM